MKNGIRIDFQPSTSRALKMMLSEGDPTDLIDEMTAELLEGVIINKQDIAFWVMALGTLAAGLKTELSPAQTEIYKMLQKGIKTQVTHVQISKNGFKEGTNELV